MWFRSLMGFDELDPEQVRSQITVEDDAMTSRANGARYGCGRLSTPQLATLRAQVKPKPVGRTTLREIVGDVQALHRESEHAGALFQAASQFNLLEMVSPDVTPDAGVGIYEHDRTQGPACAIACGAGTIFRNYFAPVGDGIGQTATRQIDCLADVGHELGNENGALWQMRNGYALLSAKGLSAIEARLKGASESTVDALRGRLRIGLHRDVQVTLDGARHRVTQVYGSALPVAYGQGTTTAWAPLARLILEASYEATLLAAVANSQATGNRSVFLTLLGGGVFGNPFEWIAAAIHRALSTVADAGLDVGIVSYGRSSPDVRALVAGWRAG